MEGRREFFAAAKEPGINFAELCREYGISRKTGYKWLKRAEHGVFEDTSRRPKSSPLRVSAELVAEIVRMRTAHRFWGPKKISTILHGAHREAPTPRTVARILERCGLLQPLARRPPPQKLEKPTIVPKPKKPNELWTVDFKGWWLAKNGERCEPLTVKDGFSHCILAIEVFESTEGAPVRKVFERLFAQYGIPKAIQTDNGPPFVAPHSWHGLSSLSVWWTSLGIVHYRSRPATPSDNGSHERMHGDIARELERFAAMTRSLQQAACDEWRHDYNHHRPHEANGMKTPASVYRRSPVEYSGRTYEPTYPDDMHERRVTSTGVIKFMGKRLRLSETLCGRTVGLEPTAKSRVLYVWFGMRRLGIADFTQERPQFRSGAPEPVARSERTRRATQAKGKHPNAAHKRSQGPRAEQRQRKKRHTEPTMNSGNNPLAGAKIRKTV